MTSQPSAAAATAARASRSAVAAPAEILLPWLWSASCRASSALEAVHDRDHDDQGGVRLDVDAILRRKR